MVPKNVQASIRNGKKEPFSILKKKIFDLKVPRDQFATKNHIGGMVPK